MSKPRLYQAKGHHFGYERFLLFFSERMWSVIIQCEWETEAVYTKVCRHGSVRFSLVWISLVVRDAPVKQFSCATHFPRDSQTQVILGHRC